MSASKSKPKTRKAPAVDPIFAAITEHKALIEEFGRREDLYRTAPGLKRKKTAGGRGLTMLKGRWKRSIW